MDGLRGWIGVVVAVLAVSFSAGHFLWSYRDRRRWLIYYGVELLLPLMRPDSAPKGVEVRYDGKAVENAHVVRLRISVRAPKAITSERFYEGNPIRMALDAEVLGLLSVSGAPASPALPPVTLSGNRTIELGPGLLHRKHRIQIEVLTSGPVTRIRAQDHLVDVDLTERNLSQDEERAEWRASFARKALLWGGLAFLVLFIAFNPSDMADIVRALGNGLVHTAESFGSFIGGLFAYISGRPGLDG